MAHLLSFLLAEKEYAVSIDSVREVRRIKMVTPVPQAMDFIEGVVSLKGKVVPIINLRKKLGIPGIKQTTLNRVLITETNSHILGIAVDSVIGVTNIKESDIEPPDEILKKAGYLSAVGKAGKRLLLIIDIAKLLSGEEAAGITTMHKKVEIRKKA